MLPGTLRQRRQTASYREMAIGTGPYKLVEHKVIASAAAALDSMWPARSLQWPRGKRVAYFDEILFIRAGSVGTCDGSRLASTIMPSARTDQYPVSRSPG